MNIFKINEEFLPLKQALETGELTPELESQLELNEENFSKKIGSYLNIIGSLNGDVETIDKEIERLESLKKPIKNSLTRLKNNISQSMQLRDVSEYKTGTHKLSFRKSVRMEILDKDLIDKKYIKTKTTESIDTVLIKSLLKDGAIVNGAVLTEHQNLQIK